MVFNLFKKKITFKNAVNYIEQDLNIKLDHESCCSKYYKIGKITLRVSDHLQDRTKECVGLSVVDGTAIINIFKQVITITTFKELKFFLWSLLSLYNGEHLNEIYKKLVNSQHKKEIDLIKDLVTKELTTKFSEKERNLKQIHKNEIKKLSDQNENLSKKLSQKENQVISLHHEIAYLNKLRNTPSKNKKNKSIKSKIASCKKQLETTTDDNKELMEVILDVSNYLDKLPENLQAKILNIIGNYY